MENYISSISEAQHVDAIFSSVPFMVNAKFQWPNNSRFTPYIGGGVGVSAAILDVDNIELNNTYLTGTESDAVFAYQGFAGLRYKINDNMGLSIEYRFFGCDAPSWEAESYYTETDRVKFGSIATHSLSLAFDFQF